MGPSSGKLETKNTSFIVLGGRACCTMCYLLEEGKPFRSEYFASIFWQYIS